MRTAALTGTGAFLLALVCLTMQASAQDAEVLASVGPDDAEEVVLFDDDELADLVAPIALYPDSLLAQVLVAATYPLEVVKADRFVDAAADLSDGDRADAAEAEDWDPSVVVLAAGFPTVVQRMAEELDWTEDLGDAMLLQTEDVLDAVQLMRARASAAGTLASNEAQVVEFAEDAISIAPADPQVIYVPTYDTQTVYAAQPTYATAPAPPVYTTVDDGFSTTNVLTTGAIAFGAALLVDEIFDDDDDNNNNNYYNDYWRPNHDSFDWDDGDFNPRPNINVDGDVNINVEGDSVDVRRRRDVDRDRLDADGKWRPSDDRKQEARDRLKDREKPGVRPSTDKVTKDSKDRDKLQAKLKDRQDRPNAGGARDEAKDRPGRDQSAVRDKLKDAADKRKPRDRDKPEIGGRPEKPVNVSRPATRDKTKVADKAAQRDRAKNIESALKPKDKSPAQIDRAKDRASVSAKDRVKRADEPKLAAAKKTRDVKAPRPAAKKPSAFKPAAKSAAKERKASDRGAASVSRERVQPKKAAARPKAVHKPKAAKPVAKKSSAKSSAFNKPKSGGSRAKSSSKRGGKSKKRG